MISWGKMRKVLENDNIADCLKGRLRYFVTHYRKSHDQEGCARIYLDGSEVLNSCYYEWVRQYYRCLHKIKRCDDDTVNTLHQKINIEALNNKGFDQNHFYEAFYIYNNSDIRQSICSENPLVRVFAVMDKRIGKRTLYKIAENLDKQPDWVQILYKIRLNAEKI